VTDFLREALVLAERARMRDGARARVAKRIGELAGRIEAASKSPAGSSGAGPGGESGGTGWSRRSCELSSQVAREEGARTRGR
jgi:hypothetical protein